VELIVFALVVLAVAGLGVWLGMLAAPHIGRLAERHDEEPDSAGTPGESTTKAGAPGEASRRRDDE